MYRYGHFQADGAFVVTDPDTPRAFDNFLWNKAVFSCVQQTGAGYCDVQIDGTEAIKLYTGIGRVCDIEAFGRDHLLSRIIYIRDNDTGEFWTVGWEPVCREYESFECEHGLGYTELRSTTAGIESSLLIFVPPGDEAVELWRLVVRNTDAKPRSLSVFAFNQFSLMYKWGFNSYGDMLYRGAWFDADANAIVVEKHPYIAPHRYLTAFMATDGQVDAFDCSRDFFVGNYRTLSSPQAVIAGRCTNSKGCSDSSVGVLQFNLELPGDSADTIHIANGLTDDSGRIAAIAKRCFDRFDSMLGELHVQKMLMQRANAVMTPDGTFDRAVNGWLKQQCLFGATWCRWGYMGYRDIVQHGFGVSSFMPERTREILLEALRHQYQSGLALRGWNPVDTKAYSDSALWLVFTLCAYLKETGDTALLDESVPFFDDGTDTVLGHVERALQFLEDNKGAHNLCLIKFGDWNDSLTGIGKEGRGESVWLSMAYAHALDLMSELHSFLGNRERQADYTTRADAMRTAIRGSAWDGEWFVRCFDDDGNPVGSSTNEQGRIFLNAQSWALISGAADESQVDTMLNSCDEHLLTDLGYRLLAPPYLERDDHIGRISYLEPGICENGTIYSHGNAFMLLALLMRGDADGAYRLLKRFTPAYVEGPDSAKLQSPPYIYANGYFGPEHRNRAFQMEFPWITGSVAWIYNAIMERMLGVRREYAGLTFDPLLPSEWDEASLARQFRGREFNIAIRRTGAYSLTLNGSPIEGRFISLNQCNKVNEVVVTI